MGFQPAITVRKPSISITLHKLFRRDASADGGATLSRYADQNRDVDLTPFLGEGGEVVTQKSVNQPAGTFSIAFPDKLDPNAADLLRGILATRKYQAGSDSLYGLIEPMDIIDIRMAANASNYAGGSPKLVMRGFVSAIRRTHAMDANGAPQRKIIVTGQNSGRWLSQYQLGYMKLYPWLVTMIGPFAFLRQLGATNDASIPVTDFVARLIGQVINKNIQDVASTFGDVSPFLNALDIDFQGAETILDQYRIGGNTIAGFASGSAWDLLVRVCDVGPWNEAWVDDREPSAGVVEPFLTVRPTPFYNTAGAAVHPDCEGVVKALLARAFVIGDRDIISMDVARSEANVINYFWVDAPSMIYQDAGLLRTQSYFSDPKKIIDQNYLNNSHLLFGLRRTTATSAQCLNFQGRKAADFDARSAEQVSLFERKRDFIRLANRDNALFESGTMTIVGNEQINPGVILSIARGQDPKMAALYYIGQVEQRFAAQDRFVTTLQLSRGLGWVDRITVGDGSRTPYVRELNKRGVYGRRAT